MELATVPDEIITTQTPTPDHATENATLRGALAAVQADFAKLKSETEMVAKGATESQSALAAALRERDTFRGQLAALEPKAKLADELQVKVEGYVNAGREAAIVETLRVKLPGADLLTLRGVLGQLHDAGKLNKFAEDHAAESAKALTLITSEAPGLARPATSASGTSLVRPNTAAPAQKTSLFR